MEIKAKHVVLILAMVAFFAMLVMAADNVEYLSIAAERSNLANSVNTGTVDFDTLEASYQRCIDRMGALEEKSDYGYLLASIDKMHVGKLVIAILMLGQLAVMVMASFMIGAFIVFTTQRILKKLHKKIRRAKARKKRKATIKKTIKARPVNQNVA